MSALGLVFQGAVAGGTSFWQALDPSVVGDVLHTRFGTVWGLRLLAWLAVAALLALPAARRQAAVLRPARLGATGVAPARRSAGRGGRAGGVLGFLCLTPALAGHASTLTRAGCSMAANFLHVVSMAVWVGGVALLLLALPAATRALEPRDRTVALAACRGAVLDGRAVRGGGPGRQRGRPGDRRAARVLRLRRHRLRPRDPDQDRVAAAC